MVVQSGAGGSGCDSYFRRTDRKSVPDGGDGGRGGDVIFRADPNAPPIGSFRYKQHITAESGGNGSSNQKKGKHGQNLVVLVPIGTKLYDAQHNLLIRDLQKPLEEVVVVVGGRPGLGNQGGKRVTKGEPGRTIELELVFKIPADIFLIGLPNSGKSTLMNRLANTKIREEEYPFSTRAPQLGVLAFSDYESLTLCELPSLYRASQDGRGMGTDFLEHLEHAKFILYFLDPVSKFANTLEEGLEILQGAVAESDEAYSKIPFAIIVNKIDLPEAKEKMNAESLKTKAPVFYLSAKTGEGVEVFIDFLKEKRKEFDHE